MVKSSNDFDMYEAAAQTIVFEDGHEPQRATNRAGMLIGAILAFGLAIIAWGLLQPPQGPEVNQMTPRVTTTVAPIAPRPAPGEHLHVVEHEGWECIYPSPNSIDPINCERVDNG